VTRPVVMASAGTYHLPFDRFSEWLERWHRRHPDVRLVVQHGPSRPVDGAENHVTLPYAQLLDLCRAADAVVLQGGAGGIMDMRAIGVVPVVVPRVPGGGEVVDNHQLVFTAEMARLGLLHRAVSESELAALLAAALDQRIVVRTHSQPPTPGVQTARVLIENGVDPTTVGTMLFRLGWSIWALLAARLRLRRSAQ